MKQQINLFQETLRPRHVRWSAKHLCKAMAVTIGAMLVFETIGLWQTWNIKQDLATAEQTLHSKTAELKTAETKYPLPQEDQRLVQRVKQLDEELRQKQQILGILSDGQYGNLHGFAEHLAGLSKQHIEGIWLTRLSIDQGGQQLGLSGGSTRPELVPQFLQRLGDEPGFAGKAFKSFVLSRADNAASWVNFELSTETSREPKE